MAPTGQDGAGRRGHRVPVVSGKDSAPVLERAALDGGVALRGPAVVLDKVATPWVALRWTATLDAVGNLQLERG